MNNPVKMRQRLIEERKQQLLKQLLNCDNTIAETDTLIEKIICCNKILFGLTFVDGRN